jgi:hypothetical protein
LSTLEFVKNGRVAVLSPMFSKHSIYSILTGFEKNSEKEKKTKTMNNLGP